MTTKLSALLVQDRVVSFRQMDSAVQRQHQYGGRIGTNLLELGHVDEGILLYYISKQRHMPSLDNAAFASVDPEALAAWDVTTASELLAVPIGFEDDRMRVAVAEPLPESFVREFQERAGIELEQLLALEFRIQQALNAFHEVPVPERFVALAERMPIPMGTTDRATATTDAHMALSDRHLRSGLSQVTPAFDAEGDEIPGLAWTGQQLAAFFETSLSRDHMLLAALGFAGKFFSRRMLLLVTRRGLRGFALQMPGEPDRPIDKAETPVASDSTMGRLVSGESYFFGSLDHIGLDPIYDQLGLPPPPDVCAIPVKVGPRAALMLVGDSGEERIDPQALPIIFLAVNQLADGLERLIRRRKLRRSAGHALATVVDEAPEERSKDVSKQTVRIAAVVRAQRDELISAGSDGIESVQKGVNKLPEDGWDFDDDAAEYESQGEASSAKEVSDDTEQFGADQTDAEKPEAEESAAEDAEAALAEFNPPPVGEDDDWVREPTDRFAPIVRPTAVPRDDEEMPEDDGADEAVADNEAEGGGTVPLAGVPSTQSMVGLAEADDSKISSAWTDQDEVIDPMADSTLSLVPNEALTPIAEDRRTIQTDGQVAAIPADAIPKIAHQIDTSTFESSFGYGNHGTGAVSLFGLRRRQEAPGGLQAVRSAGRQDPIDLDIQLPGVLQPPLLREPESEEEVAFANEILNASDEQLIEWLTSEEPERSDASFMTLLDRGQDAHDALLEVFPGPLTVDRLAPRSVMEPKSLERHGPVVWLLALQLRSAYPRIREATRSNSADARYYAARLLDQAADAEALELMADLLFDTDSQVRDTALTFIEKHLTKRDRHLHPVLPAIRDRFSSHEPWVVDVAITVVSRLRDAGAVAALLTALAASSARTRQKAAQALSTLTFQDFGVNQRQWQKWFRRNGTSTRNEWLLDAMVDREWKVRDNAARALLAMNGLIVNYSPDFERRQLDAARRAVHRHIFGRDGGPD